MEKCLPKVPFLGLQNALFLKMDDFCHFGVVFLQFLGGGLTHLPVRFYGVFAPEVGLFWARFLIMGHCPTIGNVPSAPGGCTIIRGPQRFWWPHHYLRGI